MTASFLQYKSFENGCLSAGAHQIKGAKRAREAPSGRELASECETEGACACTKYDAHGIVSV